MSFVQVLSMERFIQRRSCQGVGTVLKIYSNSKIYSNLSRLEFCYYSITKIYSRIKPDPYWKSSKTVFKSSGSRGLGPPAEATDCVLGPKLHLLTFNRVRDRIGIYSHIRIYSKMSTISNIGKIINTH